jgi:glycerol-3-phosphate acyltransferase PlsX
VIRIALDAMGGDSAPKVPVAGAVQAVRELPESFEIQLVGRQAAIEAELAQHEGVPSDRIRVIDAPEVIEMGDKPLAAIRGKRKSSIRVALERQKAGEADAFISAGNTGAVMAGSTLLLGLHEGVQRPAIGAVLPSRGAPTLVLDAGANVDCTPRELRGFAHIGAVYARDVLDRSEPSVGLLNIGEEEEKGNEAVRAAYEVFKNDPRLNFVGNVEGRDILSGDVDVVVCDGFVGNVLLKFSETIAHLFEELLKREVDPNVLQGEGMRRVFKVLDYAEYGGAPLLGTRGVAIICHGRSPARAIRNAIGVAVQAVKAHLSQHIAAEMAGNEAVV